MNKLIIGTANWLVDYYGSNVLADEVERILSVALEHSIFRLDTSEYYGNIEQLEPIINEFYLNHKTDTPPPAQTININLMVHHIQKADMKAWAEYCRLHDAKIGISCDSHFEHGIAREWAKEMPVNRIMVRYYESPFHRIPGAEYWCRSVFGRGGIGKGSMKWAIRAAISEFDGVVIGVNSADQLQEVVEWTQV